MTQIRYTLSMPDPDTHLFRVRLDIQGAPGDRVDLVLPSWTPGSYKIRDYARHVQDFSAGRLPWHKVDKSRWRIAAPGDLRVEYSVYAFELSVQSSHLDHEHGYVNGAGMFMYVDGLKDLPVTLDVKAPRGWKVATGLEKRGRLFRAPTYDVLIDSPLEIGRFQKRTFSVDGVPHHWVEHGPANHDPDRLLTDVRKIVATELKIMRHLPYKDYTFILHNTTERGGGLEHLNSTSLQFSPTGYKPREKYENFLELVAHEFFHLWNVKRIKPAMLGPFDYEKEVYTSLLWVMEGLTSYYDTLVPCRAKLYSPEKYFKRMAERVQKYEEKPGRRRQSLSASSFDTWIKLYQPNENAQNCQMSYYEKGEIVGMCLDLEIRRRSGKSLDDVMRLIYNNWGREGRGFPEGEFRRSCERVAGGSLAKFWADYVDGTAEIPWSRFLEVAGCRLVKTPKKGEDGEAARPKRAWIGIGTQRAGAALVVANVMEGSPAWKAGLSPRDELVAVDGARILPEDWEKRVGELEPGERLKLTIFRNGYLKELPLRVGGRDNVTWAIQRVGKPSEDQKRVYQAWLWNPWPKAKK